MIDGNGPGHSRKSISSPSEDTPLGAFEDIGAAGRKARRRTADLDESGHWSFDTLNDC